MNDNPATKQPETGSVCKIWVHDESFARDDVLFNASSFPHIDLTEKPLLRLKFLDSSTSASDEQRHSFLNSKTDDGFVFLAKDCDPDTKAKHPNLQVSVSNKIARLYGLKHYTEVLVQVADKVARSASHVEVCFRDLYLTRADLHRMAAGALLQQCLYEGQQITFLNSIRATVKGLYSRGRRVRSGLFSDNTKPIFRSESARYVLYIQMSREMWDFDTEGSGEIVFNKVIKDILPELFRRWSELGARHVVSVVLFTRLEANPGTLPAPPRRGIHRYSNSDGSEPHAPRDFYRVVVTEMSSGEWETIMYELKKEFKSFLKDVVMAASEVDTANLDSGSTQSQTLRSGIASRPTPAMEGNILEALNLASARFSTDWVDPDLLRSGLSIIVISPGPGFFEVDQDMLQLTTENLVKNGIGIDLLCLSERPLHEVPVFGFRRKIKPIQQSPDLGLGIGTDTALHRGYDPRFGQSPPSNSVEDVQPDVEEIPRQNMQPQSNRVPGRWTFVVPQWIQVHFWSGLSNPLPANDTTSDIPNIIENTYFTPKCRMYEVQMTGIMENEMSNISVPNLHTDKLQFQEKSMHRSVSIANISSGRSSFKDSPSSPPFLNDKVIKGVCAAKKPEQQLQETWKTSDEIAWMDDYDKAVFVPPVARNRKMSISTLTLRPINYSASSMKQTNARFNTDPINIPRESSPGDSSAMRPNLLRSQKYRSFKAPDESTGNAPELKRQDSKDSIQSRVRTSNPLMPFGGRLKTTGKASASTQFNSEAVTASQSSRENTMTLNQEEPHPSKSVSQQVKSSLYRHASVSQPAPVAEISSPPPSRSESKRASPMDVPQTNGQRNKAEPDKAHVNVPRRQHHSKAVSSSGIAVQPPNNDQTSDSRPTPTSEASEDSAKLLSPWLPISNASRPGNKLAGMASNLGWAHTFVKPPRDFGIKWKSICSPAILPLSSDYVPPPDLLRSYEENTYKITIPDEDLTANESFTRAHLLNSMVSFRLAKGFQILPNVVAKRTTYNATQRNMHYGDESFKEDGITVTMSKGDAVHSLYASGSDIQVTRYRPHDAFRAVALSELSKLSFRYNPYIKTTFSKGYEQSDVSISTLPNRLNWSEIDNFLAGYMEDFTESCGFWRTRFVLIPVEPPSSARRPSPALAEDSDDEIHIEGVQRITQLWQSVQFNPLKDQDMHANLQKSNDVNPNPLGLEFQTRDVSAVLMAGLHDFLLHEDGSGAPSTQLFSNSEKYRLAKIDLRKLAADLQGDKGIKVEDRRWFYRTHRDCFVGLDLTSWLLYNFQDVNSREEAMEVGQSLMEKGLFKHVSGRHKFRDGNFFYAIAPEFRVSRSDSRGGWFSRKSEKTSVPTTPHLGASGEAPPTPSLKYGKVETPNPVDDGGCKFPSKPKRPTVKLSSMIQCDVGPQRKSDRPEVVKVHYDRLCNPDSCYHFRLEWLDATPKLIEDAISSWASTAERYGLKLVQLPVAEACTILESNPFRSPYIVELAMPPPVSKTEPNSDPLSPNSPAKGPNFLYHRALLRKFGFVLDVEAATSYPADVDISFSWGRQKLYRYSQYIHKTGVLIAQVTDEGKFLLLANRLARNRGTLAREAIAKSDKRDDQRLPSSSHSHAQPPRPSSAIFSKRSTMASPTSGPTTPSVREREHHPQYPHPHNNGDDAKEPSSRYPHFSHSHYPHHQNSQTHQPTAEQLRDEFEAFCHNTAALSSCYDELSGRDATMSARSTPMLSGKDTHLLASSSIGPNNSARIPEASIPKLELPTMSRFDLGEARLGWSGPGTGITPMASPSPALYEEPEGIDEADDAEANRAIGRGEGDSYIG